MYPGIKTSLPQSTNSLTQTQGTLLPSADIVNTSQRLPHLLLYGPPGTGKTSTILALARRIYGAKNMRQMVLELNASDDRGIDVVREQIKTFASTKQIFTNTPSSSSASIASYKLIIQ
jgi:replication factor C subunit 3/5